MKLDSPSVDEARLRPHLRERERSQFSARRARERDQGRILDEALTAAEATGRKTTMPARAVVGEPGDLRGIPAIARGVGGAQPGTQPERRVVSEHGDWRPTLEAA